MKIALLVPGLLREYKESFNSLKNTFDIPDVNLDVYIHTWKTNKDMLDDKWGQSNWGREKTNYNNFTSLPTDTAENYLLKINEIINITKYEIEEQVGNEGVQSIRDNLGESFRDSWSPHNLSCQLYSMYKCNELRKQSNIDYDLVIRARTELIFERSITLDDLESIMSSRAVNIPSGGDHHRGINDMVAIGTPDIMDWYCELGEHYDKGENPHVMLKTHLNKKHTIERIDLPYKLRGNSIN